jgi:hypothetical protein
MIENKGEGMLSHRRGGIASRIAYGDALFCGVFYVDGVKARGKKTYIFKVFSFNIIMTKTISISVSSISYV